MKNIFGALSSKIGKPGTGKTFAFIDEAHKIENKINNKDVKAVFDKTAGKITIFPTRYSDADLSGIFGSPAGYQGTASGNTFKALIDEILGAPQADADTAPEPSQTYSFNVSLPHAMTASTFKIKIPGKSNGLAFVF